MADWTNHKRASRRERLERQRDETSVSEDGGFMVSVGDTVEWCATRKEAWQLGRHLADMTGEHPDAIVVQPL